MVALSQKRQVGATKGLAEALLPEMCLEKLNHTKRELSELFERWDNRLTWPVHISEKYTGGALSIIIKFERVSGGDICDIDVLSVAADKDVSFHSDERRSSGWRIV